MIVFINPGHAPNWNPDQGTVNTKTVARERQPGVYGEFLQY